MATFAGDGGRDWSALPADILTSIADLVAPFGDLAAFSATCPSWRAAARHSTAPQCWRFFDPAALGSAPPPCPGSRLPLPKHLADHVVGVSGASFIVVDPESACFVIVHAFSGEEIRSPPLPPSREKPYKCPGAAVVLKSNTLLVIFSFPTSVFQWQIGEDEWAASPRSCIAHYPIRSVAAMDDGRLFAIDRRTLFALHLEPHPSFTPLVNLPEGVGCLAVCGETLLYLRFYTLNKLSYRAPCLAEVLRLEQPGSAAPAELVEIEGLGDWAAFVMPLAGMPALAFKNPERWGLRSNCLYLAIKAPIDETNDPPNWDVIPLNRVPDQYAFERFVNRVVLYLRLRRPWQVLLWPMIFKPHKRGDCNPM